MNVGEITRRAAAQVPAKEALVDPVRGRRVSYRELEDRVEMLARVFAADPGLAIGDRVVVLATNCVEYFEIYLAAARAGLIAQGLNWRLAPEELARIVDSVDPRIVVFDSEFAAQAEYLQEHCDPQRWLCFGSGSDSSYDAFVERGRDLEAELPEPDPRRGIMIIYTGGTTGDAKGALHTDGGCIAAMVNNTVAERIVPGDRYMLQGQMFHSAAILALNYLLNGATVVLLPRFEARTSLESMEAERVTASLVFPAMLNYLLETAGGGGFDLSSLRNVQYGGGPLAPEVILSMMDALPCTFIQNYGSSEHVGVTFLTQEDHLEAKAGRNTHRLRSCGREALLTRVQVLDDSGRPVPRDGKSPGEVFVRAPSNMAGYWQRPDLTAQISRGPWLGSGDLAVWDEDGYLYIVDRAKDVIISGGENIYAIQIEKAIAAHTDVLEVAVVGTPDELWGESVTAFVTLRPGAEASKDDLVRQVGGRLGSYQKPKQVHFIDELPKSGAGKIDKKALRALDPLRP